jgi:hypothetical protein
MSTVLLDPLRRPEPPSDLGRCAFEGDGGSIG